MGNILQAFLIGQSFVHLNPLLEGFR